MHFIPTAIPDILIIEPEVFSDERGFFLETYQRQQFQAVGIHASFIQDNHSGSHQGTLRGLHYQILQPQAKLVRAIAGEVFDVAVDMRRYSPTFGQWVGVILSAENKRQVWIPKGFAHGIYVLSPWAEIFYKVSDYYAPAFERTLLWNDPLVGVQWPIEPGTQPKLSSKDAAGARLGEAEVYESPESLS